MVLLTNLDVLLALNGVNLQNVDENLCFTDEV